MVRIEEVIRECERCYNFNRKAEETRNPSFSKLRDDTREQARLLFEKFARGGGLFRWPFSEIRDLQRGKFATMIQKK